jgi:transcriptional regulator
MTYLPKHFEETSTDAMHQLVDRYPLACCVLQHEGELLVNHLPMLLDPDRGEHGMLVGHVARANPMWQAAGSACVAVFQGPQAYVSPSFYPSKQEHGKVVPTWNYAVVHAHGSLQTFDQRDRLLALVTRLTASHEAQQAAAWQVSDAPADYIDAMLKAIVGIEIPVQRWVGKFKTSQNRSNPDRLGVAAALRAQATPQADAMAELVLRGIEP